MVYGRKKGWSVYLQAQNYVQVDKSIVRNISYFIIYKLNDNITINNIIRNHNINNLNKNTVLNMYNYSTKNKGDFLLIDLKNDDPLYHFRHNFNELLEIINFK